MFKICNSKTKDQFYVIWLDEFMTRSMLDSIGMHDKSIFYHHFHLKLNLERALLSKCKVLKSITDFMFRILDEDILNSLCKKSIHQCKDSNNF